jgi:hypothetical protein
MTTVDTMSDEKKDIDHMEKAHDVSPPHTYVPPEEIWTLEEEKAVVYVS